MGSTTSTNFPTTAGAYQTSNQAGPDQSSNDVFVTKLNASGTALIYSTYLGGNTNDFGRGIAIDTAGNAYVTGFTYSTNFPTTTGAYRTTYTGGSYDDIFVTKLNPTGTALIYSTFMGGNGYDDGNSIAVDSTGQAFVAGTTTSTNFPTTTGAFHTALGGGGGQDAYVFKLNTSGSGLVYSTYIGGTNSTGAEIANSVVVDSTGKIYVAGITMSASFPNTAGVFQSTFGGGSWDAFVLKLNPVGTGTSDLIYSSLFGGNGNDIATQLILDSSSNIIVVGWTTSTNFPTTAGAYQTGFGAGGNDAFVLKINPTLSGNASLLYSSYLGGSGSDAAYGVSLDSTGSIYVSGSTNSPNFPTTSGAYQTNLSGGYDTFVTKMVLVIGAPILNSAAAGSQQIVLAWVAPNDNGAAGVTGYKIYRSTGGGAFVQLNSTPVTGTIYTDSGLTNGTAYTYKITALGSFGENSFSNSLTATPAALPSDPTTVAPVLDRSVATTMISATNFLYTGANPIQTGVVAGTIDPTHIAVLRGRVLLSDGTTGLPGVTISIVGHSEYGSTKSRNDGRFDLAVNGGNLLTIDFKLNGFISAQR